MSATWKFIHQDVIGGALGKVNSNLPELESFQLVNNSFTKLAILVGTYAALKGTWCAIKWLTKRRPTLPSRDLTVMTKRYGEKSWAVVDIQRNEKYAMMLAECGFNIILIGSADRIQIGRDMVMNKATGVEIEEFEVDWKQEQLNEAVYKALEERFQYYDISILVTPKVNSLPVQRFNETSPLSVVMPVFLLVSTFLKKLKNRSHRSAIIVNCDFRSGKVEDGRSLENAAVSAVETFATTLEYEIRGYCDLVIAKSTEWNALDSLGVKLISTD